MEDRIELSGFLERVDILRMKMRLRSEKDLARASGINESTMHNFWRPDRKALPYADDAVRIARALGTSVEYLVTGEGPSGSERQDPDLEQICSLLRGLTHDQLVELRGMIRERIETHFKGAGAAATGS